MTTIIFLISITVSITSGILGIVIRFFVTTIWGIISLIGPQMGLEEIEEP